VEGPISGKKKYSLTPKAIEQVTNYRNGDGLILNTHITHHGGTTLCTVFGRAPNTKGSPTFACMHVQPEDNVTDPEYPNDMPWTYNETAANVEIVKKYFHMISWEFGSPKMPLNETNWEYEKLVSVYVSRDPLSRLLAGDGMVLKKYPGVLKEETHVNATLQEWWDFAHEKQHTNNYALRVLAGNGCCNGSDTKSFHLENAKQLLSRYTFILDMACFDQSMSAMADILGITITPQKAQRLHHTHKSPKERIPYPDVYDYLVERNKMDIALYEWTKTQALVKCDELL
jgi:hypothetical protein